MRQKYPASYDLLSDEQKERLASIGFLRIQRKRELRSSKKTPQLKCEEEEHIEKLPAVPLARQKSDIIYSDNKFA